MSSSGGPAKLLETGGDEELQYPRWSPEGSKIAFVTRSGIYTMSSSGRNIQLVAPGKNVAGLDWARRGDRLLYWGDNYNKDTDIHLLDLATHRSRSIGRGVFASWGPGGRILYTDVVDESTRIIDSGGNQLGKLLPGKPAPNTSIEVRRDDGKLVTSFVASNDLQSVGLSRHYLVALLGAEPFSQDCGCGPYRIQIYSLPGGRLLRSLALKRGSQYPELRLLVSGARAVYGTRHSIRLLDLKTGKSRLVARIRGQLADLSFSGSRALWGENVELHPGNPKKFRFVGYVRSLTIG